MLIYKLLHIYFVLNYFVKKSRHATKCLKRCLQFDLLMLFKLTFLQMQLDALLITLYLPESECAQQQQQQSAVYLSRNCLDMHVKNNDFIRKTLSFNTRVRKSESHVVVYTMCTPINRHANCIWQASRLFLR